MLKHAALSWIRCGEKYMEQANDAVQTASALGATYDPAAIVKLSG
jgi:hypothetical protein